MAIGAADQAARRLWYLAKASIGAGGGRPVRVQWSREDELGWDPKGPPQLLDISGTVGPEGDILDWRTEMWLPEITRGLPNIPLLAPAAAELDQVRGMQPGLISQNGDPPYAADSIQVVVHWLKNAPLRPAPADRRDGDETVRFRSRTVAITLAPCPVQSALRSLKKSCLELEKIIVTDDERAIRGAR